MKRFLSILIVASAALAGCQSIPETVAGENWVGPAATPDGQEYTPEAARERGLDGFVMLSCVVGDGSKLRDCRVTQENPVGWGFGTAALHLQDGLAARSQPLPVGSPVDIPIFFCNRPNSRCQAQAAELKAEIDARNAARAGAASSTPGSN